MSLYSWWRVCKIGLHGHYSSIILQTRWKLVHSWFHWSHWNPLVWSWLVSVPWAKVMRYFDVADITFQFLPRSSTKPFMRDIRFILSCISFPRVRCTALFAQFHGLLIVSACHSHHCCFHPILLYSAQFRPFGGLVPFCGRKCKTKSLSLPGPSSSQVRP